MMKNIYILALTFLCLLCSQMSFGQPQNEGGGDSGDVCDPSSMYYDPYLCEELDEVDVYPPCDSRNPNYDLCDCHPEQCDSGDCSDPSSIAFPCEPEDSGDCSDPSSIAFPCETYDPCNPDSNSYDPCLCDPTSCQGSSDPPSDVPPESCGVIVCSGLAIDRPYLVVNLTTCQCEKTPRPWYYDFDTDGWHDADEPVKTQIDSPGGGWIKTTKGADCDDKNLLVTSNCYLDYFVDNDGDGYHSGTIRAKTQGSYKSTTLGPDCDDSPNGANVNKLNKCGKCEVEPVSCGNIDCISKISKVKLLEAASKLNVTAEHILAVFFVESEGNAFRPNGDPKILFERHYFSALTNGRYDTSHPDISNPEQGGYGLYAVQLEKLNRAYTLDPEAAIRSASFGAFQIMGKNYRMCGYTEVAKFHNDMTSRNLDLHLNAFTNYVITDNLQDELRNNKWADFARKYNGKKYKKNKYDTKMAEAYQILINNVNLMLKDCF